MDGATLTLSVPMSLDTVTMREGAQIKSNLADQTGSVTTKSLRFSPDLSGIEWKALGMPLASAVIKNSTEEEILAPSVQNVDNGIWFARLKDNKTPEFVVDESAFGMAGLWAANGDTYTISSEGAFEFKTLEEPAAPTETGTFLMVLESEYIYDYLETICLYIDNGWNLFRARGKSGDQAFPKLCLDRRQDIEVRFALYVSAMAWLRVTRRSSR